MTQDEDLESLGSIISATMATRDDDPAEDADREVEEGEHQPIVGALIANRGFRPPRASCWGLTASLTASRSDRREAEVCEVAVPSVRRLSFGENDVVKIAHPKSALRSAFSRTIRLSKDTAQGPQDPAQDTADDE